jgi:hypothetical protein
VAEKAGVAGMEWHEISRTRIGLRRSGHEARMAAGVRRGLWVLLLLGACGKSSKVPQLLAPNEEAGAGGQAETGASAGRRDAPQAVAGSSVAGGSGGTSGTTSVAEAAGDGGMRTTVDERPTPNYAVSGSWPARPVVLVTKPGQLKYTKLKLEPRFLADSCAIGDYNGDGLPDISSGRRWYERHESLDGPTTYVPHVFREGHEGLPTTGASDEQDTSVPDDRADYAVDVDSDGYVDIINISNPDTPDEKIPARVGTPQPHATAYWYKNPGAEVARTEAFWERHLMHLDIRGEEHGLGDVDGDGMPEIYGACKGCQPAQTFGYYQADAADALAPWTFHSVTSTIEFPFGGIGKLHGTGFGDANGDGKVDLLEPHGVWLDVRAPSATPCPGPGCGWWQTPLATLNMGPSSGGSQMYTADLDGDGDADVISAEWAHGEGLSWYEQKTPGTFAQHRFMGAKPEVGKYGVYFTEPHALEVADMDGDGVPDIITGKTHFAQPLAGNDPDPYGKPVVYVFRTVREPGIDGSPVRFVPTLVDEESGVGYQIAIGHLDKDGILDMCIASKLGLFLYFGT